MPKYQVISGKVIEVDTTNKYLKLDITPGGFFGPTLRTYSYGIEIDDNWIISKLDKIVKFLLKDGIVIKEIESS